MTLRRTFALLLLVAAASCGGSGGSTPTTPSTPAPTPVPTPVPTPTPNPYAAACGTPLPPIPDAYGFKVKVQFEVTKDKKILNASPQVANPTYCQAAGMGGNSCNPRNENDPTRVPCDHYLAGTATTGVPGPDWFERVGSEWVRCPGPTETGGAPHCRVNEANQYLLDVKEAGTYQACGGEGTTHTCGVCTLDPDQFHIVHRNPAGLCN
jgi:hypothetical protein